MVEDASEPAAPERLTVRLNWAGVEAVPVQHVNQALGQLGTPVKGIPDGLYLVLGSVEPPVIPDEESRALIVEGLMANGAQVTVQGRFHLSRETAGEIIRVLQDITAQYDAAARLAEEGSADLAGQEG
jgi:hypothetical protein